MVRGWLALGTMVLLALVQEVAAGDIELHLKAPHRIVRGRPYTIEFRVTNTGNTGYYFKRPWKWASDGLLLRAVGEDGSVVESETRLADIAASERCTYFRPVAPGEVITFREELRASPGWPELRFRKRGRYALHWVYDARHYDDESACAKGGWPIWKDRRESLASWVFVE